MYLKHLFARPRQVLMGSGAVMVLLLLTGAIYLWAASGFHRTDLTLTDNTLFFDRRSRLLRFVPDQNGERHLWLAHDQIPDLVKKAFIAAEDHRFHVHPGFDLPATLRALKDNVQSGQIVSGASTITQQVSRLVYPRERTYRDKFVEILRSIRLEISLTKDEILELYLNRVPMGNNIVGVELASRTYFNKTASKLTVAEAALLASLPKAPGHLNPYGPNKTRLLKRKDWVLSRMAELGTLNEEALKEALEEEIRFCENTFPFEAPHLVDLLMGGMSEENLPGPHHTTIDQEIQNEVERILDSHEVRLAYRGAAQAAAMVVRNSDMEVLASAGSLSYSSRDKGYNNGTTALRSAGSTLKPLVYALALESGQTVASLLQDTLKKYRTPLGDYRPVNYDRKEYGPVTMRTALGNSLNISAIRMLERVGIPRFYEQLKSVNLINDPQRGPDHYGLGLVLGNPEVSLEQLVTLYAMFANGGVYQPLHYVRGTGIPHSSYRVFAESTAYIISDILSDPSARTITFGNSSSMTFPFRVALKTGTSTRYRDAWIIGFTPEYTVGVWVGNFEGHPTYALSGAAGAAPICKDIIHCLYREKSPSVPSRPREVVESRICGISGMTPGPHCLYLSKELFIRGTEPVRICTFHKNKSPFHKLPVTYASWVYEKNKRGLAGGYRLNGFSSNLEKLFSQERQGEEAQERPVKESRTHYSLGSRTERNYRNQRDSASIIYPLPGDRFILDQGRNSQLQRIRLQVHSTEPWEYIDWFIDGNHFARKSPPYHTYWKLKKGVHRITAVTPVNFGSSIQIVVE